MAIEIEEYHEELFQEIHGRADAEGRFVEDAFFDAFTESLLDAGEIETADRVHHVSPREFEWMVMGATLTTQTQFSV